jgi:Flp pilus assembly pilin Flp
MSNTTVGQMRKPVQRFLEDNSGAAAIEYGLIAAGISLTIIISLAIIVTALIAAIR